VGGSVVDILHSLRQASKGRKDSEDLRAGVGSVGESAGAGEAVGEG
jgi:hypothetical protein